VISRFALASKHQKADFCAVLRFRGTRGRNAMHRQLLLAVALLGAFATPAFPATRYFVAQHVKTHDCSITTTTPDGETMLMVGKAPYKSAAEATAAVAVAKECNI
jgi:hypothetical protein